MHGSRGRQCRRILQGQRNEKAKRDLRAIKEAVITIKSKVGFIAFWVCWPGLYFYFKPFPERSRVLVVAGDEFLAVRPWLGKGRYILPGGGKKRQETLLSSAVRELNEETGIDAPESSL